MPPRNVLLLRSPSDSDPYHTAVEAASYHPYSLPVLETVFVSLDELANTQNRDPVELSLSGVILTSSRAAEAWRTAANSLHILSIGSLKKWYSLPFYVVGRKTAEALTAPDEGHPHVPLPSDVRGAEESGTSEKLAHFILHDLSGRPARMLYLTGDKNKDTLPSILSGGGVDLDARQVYATQGSSTFEADLERILDNATAQDDSTEWWIVFFAPSSAAFAVPRLHQFNLPSNKKDIEPSANTESGRFLAQLAAIGPTTSESLTNDLHLHVAVVPAKPTPESLSSALKAFDEGHPKLL